jgi:SAM-dependent methyltransferase
MTVSAGDLARRQARHDYENVYLKLLARLDDLLAPAPRSGWSILDIGCGYHAPLVALFEGAVGTVCGVDVENVFLRDGRLAVFKDRRRGNGWLRAAKWATVRYNGYREYYRELSRLAGRPLDLDRTTLSSYDGQHLPFADGSFDAVVSNAVLEHVADLGSFVDECARVLKPEGALDMVWHNFYSLSGRHMGDELAHSDPWGHLFGGPAGADLNRKLPDEFRAAVAERFEVVRVIGVDRSHRLKGEAGYQAEGEDQLTGDLRLRLAEYPDDLLTTRSYLVQGTAKE